MILRSYQRAAIDATYAYWESEGGSPLIELATGAGKSVVIATMVRELMTRFPGMRILMLVHVRELVEQNAKAIIKAWPGAPVGINCAGLGRRDTKHPIVCASIQSVAKYGAALGERHLVIVDEAHLIPHGDNGSYHKLLGEMRSYRSPDLRLWGCTATPYRLDTGRLDQGDGKLFDRIVYTYGIGRGVADGHLAPLVSRATDTTYDVTGVTRRGGEFVSQSLAAAVDREEITRAAVAELVAAGRARRSWLVFATSVAHADHISLELSGHGIDCEVVSADTPRRERDRILGAFKAGRLRCISNVGVLTTGFDAPATDLVALMRPTLSPGLLVQMIGRATRPAEGKTDALVLDFAGNIARHGPVDEIEGPSKTPGKGEAPIKVCESCKAYNPISALVCKECGSPFDIVEGPDKLQKTASALPVLSGRKDPLDWRPVDGMSFAAHRKFGADPATPPTMRVTYHCGRKAFSEWVCVQHPTGSFPREKAERWWLARSGERPCPQTVSEAVDRAERGEIVRVAAIRVRRDGEHDRIVAHRNAASDPNSQLLQASS